MAITLERQGQRIYFLGDTYAAKDQIKALGAKPGEFNGKFAWWIGTAKLAEAEAFVANVGTAPSPKREVNEDSRLAGKAKYKGRTYYVLWVGQCKSGDYKAHLTVLNGSIDFWAKCARPGEQCDGDGNSDTAVITKTYAPREYRGQTQYTTLGSIKKFIEREQENRANGGAVCAACGRSGDLVEDLEDGLMKHRGCADMPS